MFILNNLLVELIDMDLLLAMRRPQHIHKVLHKLLAIAFDVLLRILADQQHLSDVAFALDVAASLLVHLIFSPSPTPSLLRGRSRGDLPFKPVLIAHLLLACLAVPAQSA